MSSKTKDEKNKEQKAQQKAWRATALASLNFKNLLELSQVADVNNGELSAISQGKRDPSDGFADKLILAIKERNYTQGWSYRVSAHYFQEAFNYLRNHYATQRMHPFLPIEDEDVERWCYVNLKRLNEAQSEFDDPLSIVSLTSSTTQDLLTTLLKFLHNWEMKHDFGYLGKVKRRFEANKILFIYPVIKRGMREEGHYEAINAVYTNIRHIAHLCGEFDLVRSMSDWLIEKAKAQSDHQTVIKSQVTLAWLLTSQDTRESLFEAQKLVKEIGKRVDSTQFLESVSLENMDVIAIFAELRLRLAIRLDKHQSRPLEIGKFDELMEQSIELLRKPKSFKELEPKLQARYSLPIDYQHGVYLYGLKNYKEAIYTFTTITILSNLIGWTRVEQAAYSWLATLFEETEEYGKCLESLSKINAPYLQKRLNLCERIRTRITDVDLFRP